MVHILKASQPRSQSFANKFRVKLLGVVPNLYFIVLQLGWIKVAADFTTPKIHRPDGWTMPIGPDDKSSLTRAQKCWKRYYDSTLDKLAKASLETNLKIRITRAGIAESWHQRSVLSEHAAKLFRALTGGELPHPTSTVTTDHWALTEIARGPAIESSSIS